MTEDEELNPEDQPDGTGEPPHPAGPWGELPEDSTDDPKWTEDVEDDA